MRPEDVMAMQVVVDLVTGPIGFNDAVICEHIRQLVATHGRVMRQIETQEARTKGIEAARELVFRELEGLGSKKDADRERLVKMLGDMAVQT